MQQTDFFKTPAKELLELLCRERIEQHYRYEIQQDKEYTTITFYNKELVPDLMTETEAIQPLSAVSN